MFFICKVECKMPICRQVVQKTGWEPDVVSHTSNPSTCGDEAGGTHTSRLAWAILEDPIEMEGARRTNI